MGKKGKKVLLVMITTTLGCVFFFDHDRRVTMFSLDRSHAVQDLRNTHSHTHTHTHIYI